jgi:hypothetical protein
LRNLSSFNNMWGGVKDGTFPVTCSVPKSAVPALPVRKAAEIDLEEETLVDVHDEALA